MLSVSIGLRLFDTLLQRLVEHDVGTKVLKSQEDFLSLGSLEAR